MKQYEIQIEAPDEDGNDSHWRKYPTSRTIRGVKDAVRYIAKENMIGSFRVIAVLGTLNAKAVPRTVTDIQVEAE